MMGREDPQLKLRLTEELKMQITEAARANGRSVNAEIVQRLEESFLSGERISKHTINSIIDRTIRAMEENGWRSGGSDDERP